jgi:hypothetical protein
MKDTEVYLIAIFAVLIIPSNIVFPQTGVNILRPIDYNLYDYSAPEINLKDVPEGLKNEIKESVVVGYFSPEVEWYLKKPDFVVPFSMDGRGRTKSLIIILRASLLMYIAVHRSLKRDRKKNIF